VHKGGYEMNAGVLKSRWCAIEDRKLQITYMLDELEEIGNFQEEYDIKSSRAYLLLELELNMINEEQRLIEKTGALFAKE
jgi:hypothetical protein